MCPARAGGRKVIMMGTALGFSRPERASFAAAVLLWFGHGVRWLRESPRVVMTSAPQSEVRELLAKHPGTFPHWETLDSVDEGRRS